MGMWKQRGAFGTAPASQGLPLLLISPSQNVPLALGSSEGRAAFNSETPLVPPRHGSSSQVPHLWALDFLLVLGTGQTWCMRHSYENRFKGRTRCLFLQGELSLQALQLF